MIWVSVRPSQIPFRGGQNKGIAYCVTQTDICILTLRTLRGRGHYLSVGGINMCYTLMLPFQFKVEYHATVEYEIHYKILKK